MIREEIIYEDALDVMEKAMKGEPYNPGMVYIATIILKDVFSRIYDAKILEEMNKKADSWNIGEESS